LIAGIPTGDCEECNGTGQCRCDVCGGIGEVWSCGAYAFPVGP